MVGASNGLAIQLLENPQQEKGTYLGTLFCPIPEALLDHLPQLPREGGVMITHVLPNSPASAAKLQRHDILLQYNDVKIRDCNHFAELISSDRPEHTVNLGLIRKGKATQAKVILKLGPVLRIAKGTARGKGDGPGPNTVAKEKGPDKLSVTAEPMDGNRMKVVFEFYQKGTGKLRQITCSGTPTTIDEQVKELLPSRFQTLANAAIKRLRDLKFQQQSKAPTPDEPDSR